MRTSTRAKHHTRNRPSRAASLVSAPAAMITVLALGLALTPATALAALGPPSSAPPLAKRICLKYTVIHTHSGPSARCTAHKTETVRRTAITVVPAATSPRASSSSSTSEVTGGVLSAPKGGGGGTPPRGTPARSPRAPGPPSRGAPRARSDLFERGQAAPPSGGMSLGAILALTMGGVLLLAALVMLLRKPLIRWRGFNARGGAAL